MAVRRWLRSNTAEPNEGVIMELSGFRVIPGSPASLRRSEVKKPNFDFPHGNQIRGESDKRFTTEVGVNTGYHSTE